MDGWMGCSRVGLEVSSMVDLEISWSTVGQDISRSPVGFVISWSRVGRAAAQKSGCHGLAPAQIPSTHSVSRVPPRSPNEASRQPQVAPKLPPRNPKRPPEGSQEIPEIAPERDAAAS